ncbi:glycoside hydrolase family 172 protein [Dokdonella sp.]|uniref:glycoside hydrolase family 172 protein n=1 Tax=Dokdonella sp. TaxID=2291710 RepID=UPI003BAF47C0
MVFALTATIIFYSCNEEKNNNGNHLYEYDNNISPRWSSPENMNGAEAAGGKENNTAKGHAFDSIAAGATYKLLDIKNAGIINRMWITINDRSPEMLRALKIEMFWDGVDKPAVSVPFGDFFGVGLGQTTAFQNALFANAEGRSFNCFIQMPFKRGAKIQVVNESSKTLQLIFFDVDYSTLKNWNDDYLYFHAYWQRDTATTLAADYEILPQLQGKGRFLGTNIGVAANPLYRKSWFGEGEIKIYVDADKAYPTLNGTGTEDYIGTAWGQGKFINNYTGCSIADDSLLQWAFYRYHIPDPVFFKTACRVTMQQIGGDGTDSVAAYQQEGAPLIPVTTATEKGFYMFYTKDSIVQLANATHKGWTNFYRSDDVSAVAYFYLDKPTSNLKPLQGMAYRTAKLRTRK